MSGDRRHRKWRTEPGAKAEVMDADELRAQPLDMVRRFIAGDVKIRARHHAPGKWLIFTEAVSADDLAGLRSVVQTPRAGDGGWRKSQEG